MFPIVAIIIMGFQVITSNNPFSSFPARCIGKN